MATGVKPAGGTCSLTRPAVHRSAKVVDNRLSGQTRAVLDRLTARIDKGFGDCVAVMARSDVTVPGQPAPSHGLVHVFAHDGKRWLSYTYRAGRSEHTKTYFPISKLPEGWPRPGVREVLQLARHAVPTSFFLADGKEAWGGHLGSASRSYKTVQSMTKNLARYPEIMKAEQSLAGKVWPGLVGRRLAVGDKVELMKDDKHPGQVGLREISFYQVRQDVKRRNETVLWLDPAREDMPVEKTYRSYASDNKTVKNERHTKYLDYSQLPSGQWYPTRWRQTTTYRGADKDVQEYNLQIIPNMKLDDEWFTSPAKPIKKDDF